MIKIKMTCLAAEILFATNSSKVAAYFLTDEDHVPETIPAYTAALLDDEVPLEGPYLQYIDSEEKRVSFDPVQNQAVIYTPEEALYLPDLIYLLLSMFSKELNYYNQYILHCSAVEKDGKAIVLVGEPGSGKTTLALQFCITRGYNLVSNDRAIIGMDDKGRIKIFSGTLQMHIRVGVIHEYFPQLISAIDAEKINSPWSSKIYINPPFTGLGINVSEEAIVGKIVYISTYPVDDNLTNLIKNPVDVATLATMKHISECIRASRNVVISTGSPFPCFDTGELADKRVNFVHQVVQNTEIYDARGNIPRIVELLDGR
ncbi:MAG: hypothetical protein FWB99_00815 [Treponema sp.]|nr:hypothetical protein [Treponema sp.]